jgi:hypothetical protein
MEAGIGRALFTAAVDIVLAVKRRYPFTTEEEHRLAVEITWFMVATIVRDSFLHPSGGAKIRDEVQDDLVSQVVLVIVDGLYEWSGRGELRVLKANEYLAWYNESEEDYSSCTSVFPSEPQLGSFLLGGPISPGSLLSKLGDRATIPEVLKWDILNLTVRCYSALNVPSLTVQLVEQARTKLLG